MNKEKFMRRAIELSIENVKNGGGPFGAVIVKNNEILAEAVNSVTTTNDPTAHAEINAIRLASKKINHFDLKGCDIYSSCEPCPMCLSAIYWARIEKLYFGNTKNNAKDIGFDDAHIYNEIKLHYSKRSLITQQVLNNEALEAFKLWDNYSEKIKY